VIENSQLHTETKNKMFLPEKIRHRTHEIIFEADTPTGKTFDVLLIVAIFISVSAVILESVPSIEANFGPALRTAEWTFTILFSLEYFMRLICVRRPLGYVFSFFGVIDFLAFMPTYLAIFFGGAQVFLVVRVLRLLRLFRILKMIRYVTEADTLVRALKASRPKILIFLFAVGAIVTIVGAIMHLVEQSTPGFESIPSSMYWAIVTVTTVGYGDVIPITGLGRFFASILMVMGYGIIAVPTGIITSEFITRASSLSAVSTQVCESCSREGHAPDAIYCKFCGAKL